MMLSRLYLKQGDLTRYFPRLLWSTMALQRYFHTWSSMTLQLSRASHEIIPRSQEAQRFYGTVPLFLVGTKALLKKQMVVGRFASGKALCGWRMLTELGIHLPSLPPALPHYSCSILLRIANADPWMNLSAGNLFIAHYRRSCIFKDRDYSHPLLELH
jgi:hypothetical protein